MADTKNDVDKKLEELVNTYQDKLNKMLKDAEKMLSNGNKTMMDSYEDAKHVVVDKAVHSKEAIENNPFKSILVTAGFSMLIGFLLGKTSG